MKSILLLPLFSMPSGHQHVAEALRTHILQLCPQAIVHKIDLLEYGFGHIEKWVSSLYMQWIDRSPGSYGHLYQYVVGRNKPAANVYAIYRILFLQTLGEIIAKTKPDIIFCTHSLPSYLCGQLKKQKRLNVPVVNVYTDFLIHQLWDCNYTDIHFLPDRLASSHLLRRNEVHGEIIITGIPVDRTMTEGSHLRLGQSRQMKLPRRPLILIAGGHAGAGGIEQILQQLEGRQCDYLVLCGKNKSLFDSINRLKQPAFRALGYISDKQQMLQIYESADAMITKAGGVTMSECLLCMLPIFIYHSLPGQETHNVRHLLAQQVLSTFDFSRPLEAQIVERLFDLNEMKQRNAKLERYRAQFFDPISEATHLSQALRSLLK